jgi:stress response protein YsnF
MTMEKTVIAIFNYSADAQEAVNRLLNEGLTRDNIDVSYNTANETQENKEYGATYKQDNNESGISRFFKSLFGNDDEADVYTKVAGKNSSIVTVYAKSEEEAERAAEILDEAGAIDVDDEAIKHGYNSKVGTGKETMDSRSGNDSTSIPVIEENVQIGKREVETGGSRLKSRIVEHPVEEHLRLREEYVTVERNPVDRKATTEDLQNFQESEIELVEHAEVPVVSKEARVVEEVKLNKEVQHRDEKIKETVRKTEVEVENIEKKKEGNKRNKMDSGLTD